MANSYQIIDEKTWERAMHCMVFRNSVEPAFCVTFGVELSNAGVDFGRDLFVIVFLTFTLLSTFIS